MRIAIHHTKKSFSDDWIQYCDNNNIDYKIVNAYSTDIIKDLEDCDAFMWHHHHGNPKDILFAKQLLTSIQSSGKIVFPDINTGWHFDDKVGQKYLLESINAPIVPSYIFYSKKDSATWINSTTFPKVFKLRGGAGAVNVKLVKNKKEAYKLVKKAFNKGFKPSDSWASLNDRILRWTRGQASFIHVIKGVLKLFFPSEINRKSHNERGYTYFQDFMPGNNHDIRICVVDNKAFGIKRLTRDKDFRASGSGNIVYDKNQLDERCVIIAFEIAKKLKTQSIAFDFIYNKNNEPLIVEISYGFSKDAYYKCEGYWTDDMQWHEGTNFDYCGWMVESVVNKLKK